MSIPRKPRAPTGFTPAFALLVAMAVAAIGCNSTPSAAASPETTATSLDETVQPTLVKLLPPHAVDSKTLTVAVALGSPPDDFRNDKGEVDGWEIDLLRAASKSLGLT